MIRLFLLLPLLFPISLWGQELPRRVMVFYDRKMFSDVQYSPVHLNAAMPLEHLGIFPVYRPIDNPLPTEKEMEGVLGILTWFQRFDAVPNRNEYCRWAKTQMERGKKLVILGDPGVFANKERRMSPECKAMFQALGADYLDGYSDNPLFFKLVFKDSKRVEFERELKFTEAIHWSFYKTRLPGSHVYLKVKRTDLDNGVSDLVFTTPHGGFGYEDYIFYNNKEIKKVQWRLNPFLFFNEAFGIEHYPRPDTTTYNGRRIFYTHIDGDGVVNLSHIDWKSFSGEIILEEILRKYSDIPFTVSIIAGYLDMSEYESARVTKLYHDIFSLSNVEAGVHGYAHPLIWKKGTVALKIPGYHFDAEKEIVGATKMVQAVLDSQKIAKKADIYLWTGDCVLDELDVSLAYKAGILNINGGDTRFDKVYDSYGYVGALGILRGPYLQVYASAQNENTYTNLWEGPYYGFVDVIDTFKNTDAPIRIKPIDVYYHYYSGERQASLEALKTVYRYALSQPIFPMYAGDFARIVGDFFKTKMIPLQGGYKISNDGDLKTIRFDNDSRNADMNRSKGVLGFDHFQGNLYVFLDEAKEHQIYFASGEPSQPYVKEASFKIKGFKGNGNRLQFAKSGWFKSEMVLGGLSASAHYQVKSRDETLKVLSDHQGKLSIQFKNAENGPEFSDVLVERIP